MKFRSLPWFLVLFFGISLYPSVSDAIYGLGPSTGGDLPYSQKTKKLLRNLFSHHLNRPFLGAQVIALRGTPGKQYSGNYIDKGSLAGVNKGDVFALFTPKGDPIGFMKVSEVQRYTSTFEFMELTVDPSDNLIAEKVTDEIKRSLPANLLFEPDMARFHKNFAAKKKPAPPAIATSAPASMVSPSSMPPLPGNTTAASSNNLPPLPGTSSTVSANELPALPENGVASTGNPVPLENGSNNSGLPPLPMDNSSSLQPVGPASAGNNEFPTLNSSTENNQGLPAFPESNNSGLQPVGPPPSNGDEIPALPTTTNENNGGIPPLPEQNNTSSAKGSSLDIPPLPTEKVSSPVGEPLPQGNDNNIPPLPGTANNVPPNSTPLLLPELPNSTNNSTGSNNSQPSNIPLPQSNTPLPAQPISKNNNVVLPSDNNTPLLPPLNSTSSQGIPPLEEMNPPSIPNNGSSAVTGSSDLDLPALPATGSK